MTINIDVAVTSVFLTRTRNISSMTMAKTEELHRAIQVALLPEVRRLIAEGADMDRVLGT